MSSKEERCNKYSIWRNEMFISQRMDNIRNYENMKRIVNIFNRI
jgi:hypothetical protein